MEHEELPSNVDCSCLVGTDCCICSKFKFEFIFFGRVYAFSSISGQLYSQPLKKLIHVLLCKDGTKLEMSKQKWEGYFFFTVTDRGASIYISSSEIRGHSTDSTVRAQCSDSAALEAAMPNLVTWIEWMVGPQCWCVQLIP